MIKSAYLYIAHGSPKELGNNQFIDIINKIKLRNPDKSILYAFLENSVPDIPTEINRIADNKFKQITIIPVFLFSGKHLEDDIPDIIKNATNIRPELQITLAKEISLSPKFLPGIASVFKETLLKESANNKPTILICGVGSSNNNSNKGFLRIIENLQETFANAKIIYGSFSNYPPPHLEKVLHDIYNDKTLSRIIIVPLLLFEGFYTQKLDSYLNQHSQTSLKNIKLLPTLSGYNFLIEILEQPFTLK